MSGIGEDHNYDPTDEMNLKTLEAIQLLCFQRERGDISHESLLVGLNAVNLTSRGLIPQDTSLIIDDIIADDIDKAFNSVSMYTSRQGSLAIISRPQGGSKVNLATFEGYKRHDREYDADGAENAVATEERIKAYFIGRQFSPVFEAKGE